MEQINQFIQQLMSNEQALIALIASGVVLIVIIYIFMLVRRKKVKNMQKEAETRYTAIKSISLPFKMNKAESLARVNTTIKESVEQSQAEFQEVQEMLKECSGKLGEIDDYIYVHKTSTAKKELEDLFELIEKCEQSASNLNVVLDGILEQQATQREQIVRLQSKFRVDKSVIASNREAYNSGIEVLEERVLTIEKMFSTFEEWMYASEFNKAAKQQSEIMEAIEDLENLMNEYPSLYEEGKITLPKAIDETSYVYSQARNKGVFLEHLEVSRNLEIISSTLKDDLNRLSQGEIDHVMNSMIESKKRLNQLKEQTLREEKAFDELNDNVNFLFEQINHLESQNHAMNELYEKKKERFGLEAMKQEMEKMDETIKRLQADKETLRGCLLEKSIPATTLLLTYKDLMADTNQACDTFDKLKSSLETACSDEVRAQKQLLKLQLILNEITVKISKNHLPNVSLTYQDDLHQARLLVNEVTALLDTSPLNVNYLNDKIKETIDFVYTLYNSVNNLVGMAMMVENTIVFGNRYRSSYPEVDSELTRAELCFRNGQYTKALKIAIQTIEKMHPGSYEKLLRKSSQGATAHE